MNPEKYIEEVETKINEFKDFEKSDLVVVAIDQKPEGHFKIHVNSEDLSVMITHSWNESWTYLNPGTVNIVFERKSTTERFADRKSVV